MDHLLIVEDDKSFADGLVLTLKEAGYETTVVHDGVAALNVLYENPRIDLVLLDINLNDPDLNGRDVCRRIRNEFAQPPLVIFLTIHGSTWDQVDGLDCANDYITKLPYNKDVLVARIKAALRTRKEAGKKVWIIDGRLRIDTQKRKVYKDDQEVRLTRLEYDLLHVLANPPVRPFGRQQLLDAVWGLDFEGGDRTVDRHIVGLRRQIEDDPANPRYILTERGFGYQFCEW
jgi:DNA-binding response OmpR family regulator